MNVGNQKPAPPPYGSGTASAGESEIDREMRALYAAADAVDSAAAALWSRTRQIQGDTKTPPAACEASSNCESVLGGGIRHITDKLKSLASNMEILSLTLAI